MKVRSISFTPSYTSRIAPLNWFWKGKNFLNTRSLSPPIDLFHFGVVVCMWWNPDTHLIFSSFCQLMSVRKGTAPTHRDQIQIVVCTELHGCSVVLPQQSVMRAALQLHIILIDCITSRSCPSDQSHLVSGEVTGRSCRMMDWRIMTFTWTKYLNYSPFFGYLLWPCPPHPHEWDEVRRTTCDL